jgi:hypothetical protein
VFDLPPALRLANVSEALKQFEVGRAMRLGSRRSDLLAIAVQGLVFLPAVWFRFVDGDEGVYAYASRLALHGRVPYGDFFYEQTPLLPYVYGVWFRVTGESWYSGRLLSALLAVAVGLLLHRHVRRRLGELPAAVALIAYTGSALAVGYFTVIKTFALSTALLWGAYVLVAEAGRFALGGALLGLAVDARLLFLAAVPALAVAAARAGRLGRLTVGLLAALAPALVLLVLHPSAFWFDTVRYHGLKSAGGFVGDPHQKAQTVATLLGLEPTDRAIGLQFLLLLLAVGAMLVTAGRGRRGAWLPLAIAASLGAASILPTPTYVQYFSVTVPFFAVGAGYLAAAGRRSGWSVVAAAGLTAYVVIGAVGIRQFGRHDPLLRPSVASVQQVAARVQDEASPGERVLSSWPGYLFGTHARAFPDYTNQFAPVAAARLSPVRARSLHVVSETELERWIRARKARLIVYRNWVTTPPFARWDAALRDGGYNLVAEVETARIFRR